VGRRHTLLPSFQHGRSRVTARQRERPLVERLRSKQQRKGSIDGSVSVDACNNNFDSSEADCSRVIYGIVDTASNTSPWEEMEIRPGLRRRRDPPPPAGERAGWSEGERMVGAVHVEERRERESSRFPENAPDTECNRKI
jgi:hypothetical protein